MRHPRVAEIRAWAKHRERMSVAARMTIDGWSYQHWADVRLLLNELDRLDVVVSTAKTEPVLRKRPPTSDDTIAITPATDFPAFKWPTPPPALPTFTEDEVWNAAVAKCQAGVERALAEASRRRCDIHGIRGLVERYVADCRRPL